MPSHQCCIPSQPIDFFKASCGPLPYPANVSTLQGWSICALQIQKWTILGGCWYFILPISGRVLSVVGFFLGPGISAATGGGGAGCSSLRHGFTASKPLFRGLDFHATGHITQDAAWPTAGPGPGQWRTNPPPPRFFTQLGELYTQLATVQDFSRDARCFQGAFVHGARVEGLSVYLFFWI